MIVQSGSAILKQRNQPHRECLYAWYPEVVTDPASTTSMVARDIYIHKGLDKSLLRESPSTNQFVSSDYVGNSNTDDVIQRYKQSVASSEPVYHSPATIDEALQTPWALHYDVQRRVATPNISSHSTDSPIRDEPPRRLKSAPLFRSPPLTTTLTVPEPQFITPIISITTTNSTVHPKARASSARARLNITLPASNDYTEEVIKQPRREIKSAIGIRPKPEVKLSDEDTQKVFAQVYSDTIQQQTPWPPPVPSSPCVDQANFSANQSFSAVPTDKKHSRSNFQTVSLPPNLHYFHRPGVISVRNSDKKPVIPGGSTSKKASRHHRRSTHSAQRHEPLLALAPACQSRRFPAEIDGMKCLYDPSLTLDDPSLHLTKYFLNGRLYLIENQRYNVIENVDPSLWEQYQHNLTLPQRPKYYQTIPIEKFQIPKPAVDIHYNAAETFFYNTIPKRQHRYVIDPNFISENLNVNKIALSKRPPTANALHSASRDTHGSSPTRSIYT